MMKADPILNPSSSILNPRTIARVDAILLFSHGSVLCGAEHNLLELARRMRDRGDAPIVEVGFLNYTAPSFEAAVAACLEQGASRIIVAPYFLVTGKFVVKDLPVEIETVRAAHPDTEFVIAGVIGFHEALADAILDSATAARTPDGWRTALEDAAPFCREHPKCPLYGKPPCRFRAEGAA